MTILSLLNFVGIWIPAVVSALYAGLMKQLNPEYIVTMNTYSSGLRIGFFVMLLNLLVNVATFSNGKRDLPGAGGASETGLSGPRSADFSRPWRGFFLFISAVGPWGVAFCKGL